MQVSAFEKVVDRAFRWDARFLFGLLHAVRRPILEIHVADEQGEAVAMAMVSFPKRSGYISGVAVDVEHRHRGLGRRVVEACEASARRAGKSYVTLDVLSSNAPARSLYEKMGYHLLRHEAFYRKELPGPAPPEAPLPSGVRIFARRDAKILTSVASAQLPEIVRTVLPMRPSMFIVPPAVTMGLLASTEAWVVDRGHGAEAFVRATASPATIAGNLTAPWVGPNVPDDLADGLIAAAVAWLHRQNFPRIATEVPEHNAAGIAALRRAGFEEAFGADTLYRPLAA
jgi:ribosomal protein S18 acetylase RimI-like enzyme